MMSCMWQRQSGCREPSADEVAAHTVIHEPFRAWCRAYSLSEHVVSGHEHNVLAVVGFEHGFTAKEDGMPPMFGKDQTHRWFFPAAVPSRFSKSLAGQDNRARIVFGGSATSGYLGLKVIDRCWCGKHMWRLAWQD